MQVLVDIFKSATQFLAHFLKNQWTKILLTLFLAVLFFALIFPYGDLTSYASRLIFDQTGVPTHADDLGITVVPFPGATFTGLEVNISSPPVTIENGSIYPSLLSSAIHQEPFFSANFENIFGGNIDLSRSPGEKVAEKEWIRNTFEVEASNIEIAKVMQFLKSNTKLGPIDIPIQLKGKLSLNSQADVDPMMTEEPTIEFQQGGSNVVFPSQSINTAFGPIQLPELSWKDITIRGRLVGGELILETVEFGQIGDPMILKMKGRMSLRMSRTNERAPVAARPGAYEFDIDLSMSQSVESQIGVLLSPIAGDFKSRTSSGTRYLFRASGSNFRQPPKTQAIRSL